MKKNLLAIALMISTFVAVGQGGFSAYYNRCSPDSLNLRPHEQWYLLPEDTYLNLNIFTDCSENTIESRDRYFSSSADAFAQPYRVNDTISIAGLSGYVYVSSTIDNVAYLQIRDSSLENILGEINISLQHSNWHTPHYTEVFFDNPISVCGKFYVVYKISPNNGQLCGMYITSIGTNNPETYPLRLTGSQWRISGVHGGDNYNLYGDTMRTAYLFPIIADSSYMNSEDTVSTEDTLSSLSQIDIDALTNISPNPTNNICKIDCAYTIKSLQLYNETGVLLEQYHPQTNQYNLDLGKYPQGSYVVTIITDRAKTTKKIIRQ